MEPTAVTRACPDCGGFLQLLSYQWPWAKCDWCKQEIELTEWPKEEA